MIDKAFHVEMFAEMRNSAPWDVDSDLLLGYFFTGDNEQLLASIADGLGQSGYGLVEIRPDEEQPVFWLHVE